MKKYSSLRKGFTLVELMIVIAIIGILAVAVLPQVFGVQENARDSGRQAALRNVQSSMFQYYSDKSVFPWDAKTACLADLQDTMKSYTSSLPTDPRPKGYGVDWCTDKGGYGYKQIGTNYMLSAKMERQVNANFDKDAGADAPNKKKYEQVTDIEDIQPLINKKNIVKDTKKENWYYVIGQ